jgi:hypothetical protein
MNRTYEIFEVRPGDLVGDETLGSKPKFWFSRGKERWLFKEARENTGEDWAEKIAAEVAATLDIPAAKVELAEFAGRRGCASRSFVDTSRGQALIHGNEVLAGLVVEYDPAKRLRQSDHNLENIYLALNKLFGKPGRGPVLTQLAEYLVLDALIGNTDRHHENWGLLLELPSTASTPPEGEATDELSVAPTFDHASSLGRELLDPTRERLIAEHRVAWYVRRGHGGVYLKGTDRRGANPLELVEHGVLAYAEYFTPILRRMHQTSVDPLIDTVDGVPNIRMSVAAKNFAKEFIRQSHLALMALKI